MYFITHSFFSDYKSIYVYSINSTKDIKMCRRKSIILILGKIAALGFDVNPFRDLFFRLKIFRKSRSYTFIILYLINYRLFDLLHSTRFTSASHGVPTFAVCLRGLNPAAAALWLFFCGDSYGLRPPWQHLQPRYVVGCTMQSGQCLCDGNSDGIT